ncbi:two-component system response regulator CreB [Marinobacterium jannaschii]|uniref:two-component system response regulator CreB n=1 Tax=Marinobacterium jannaschii TaxID=64970 RepID=UPI000484621A|nr:two-component system response regulator CreB [Marinobacterium jannaschii]
MNPRRILIVEDEPSIADNIAVALSLDNFSSDHCGLAGDALERLREQHYALAIIDIGLPDFNGFELCKRLREFSELPVIFLTARSDEVDRILGLEIGADDYVTKPFSPRELATRVKVILKRAGSGLGEQVAVAATGDSLFQLDEAAARICYLGQPVTLTRYEFRVLAALIKQPERVFSRGQLMDIAWEAPEVSLERAVDTHIKSLRAKLRSIDATQDPIRTHRGLGYSLQR